jgi:hypothetical protein
MKLTLTFGDVDPKRTEELQQGFRDHPQLHARAVKSSELMQAEGVDAIFLTIMAAERWGARPIVHEAQVLETSSSERGGGWPSFIVAGVAGKPDDPRDPQFELRMIILAVLRAVQKFNKTASRPIRNVAFGPEWTGIRKLLPQHAAEIIRAAYDEGSAQAEGERA